MKKCSVCKELKDKLVDFYPQRKYKPTGKQYYYSQCKVCLLKGQAKRYSPLRDYKIKLNRKYGLSWEEYLVLYNSQQGRCKICDIFLELPGNTKEKRHLAGVVDHNHETGKVRGILCLNCNTGIGHLQDDMDVVEKAYKYLKDND